MKLPPEGARWLVSLRWLACAAVFAATWVTSSLLSVIANPLDGVENCLRRIGEGVKDDPHLTEYVQLMAEALERTDAKRVVPRD